MTKLGADGYHVPLMVNPMIGEDGELIEKALLMTEDEYQDYSDNEYYASNAAAELAAENAWLYAAENNQRYRDEVEYEESQSIFGYDL